MDNLILTAECYNELVRRHVFTEVEEGSKLHEREKQNFADVSTTIADCSFSAYITF